MSFPGNATDHLPCESDSASLKRMVSLSALVHLLACVVILHSISGPKTIVATEQVVWLPLADIETDEDHHPPAPQPLRQVVPPSQRPEAAPLTPTPHLSDRDTQTDREQIRRGGSESPAESAAESHPSSIAGSITPPRAPAKTAPRKQQQSKDETPKQLSSKERVRDSSPKLHLTPDDLLATLSRLPNGDTTSPSAEAQTTEPVRERALQEARPFSRNAFRSKTGVSDFLPGIPDGDITLLNAKADRYAVFVRRVALQVFSALRQENWHSLSAAEIGRIDGFSVVEAVLSPSGTLLSTRILEHSGSSPFDQALSKAANKGAWDQNPPKGAEAEDGKFRFIFKARTWARRTERGEDRWLLLGTGLL